jgi:acetoin utilization deacetylase AcuC-like enzyme
MDVRIDDHHGNGTAGIFAGDPTVFTLSIHQLNNYPQEKPPSTLDIHLEDGIGDAEYQRRLCEGYVPAIERFRPQLLIYVAGADPYQWDQLGGLALTLEGLLNRDRLVIHTARRLGIPVAITLAGGYADQVADTVLIHCNTARAARETYTQAAG